MTRKKICLHYDGNNIFLFVNDVKIYHIKEKNSEIKPYPLCLGNILKDFSIDGMNKIGLKGYVHVSCVNYNIIDTNDILAIHKYLMKIT